MSPICPPSGCSSRPPRGGDVLSVVVDRRNEILAAVGPPVEHHMRHDENGVAPAYLAEPIAT